MDTKDFDVVRIARSDGVDTGPGYWPVVTPTPAAANATKKAGKEATAADKAPRTKPQMTRLAEDDPRFVEWRIKLGILLKQELSPTPDEGNPWYVHFPRGYWLYEKSKHLWVSGYPIKSKLFKSPQEFGVHLIWLLSASTDYGDCCCVHCNTPASSKPLVAPEEPTGQTISHSSAPISIPASAQASTQPLGDAAARTEQPERPFKVTPVPLPTIPGQPAQRPPSITPRPQPVQPQQSQQPQPQQLTQQQIQQSPVPLPAHLQSREPAQTAQSPQLIQPNPSQPIPTAGTNPPTPVPAAVATTAPMPQQQQQPKAQAIQWSLKSPLLFRAGELVWYQTGNTWRLGIISNPGNMTPNGMTFELLPIGHAVVPQPNVTKLETDLRPFHCYSVPSVDIAELKDKVFDEVPWESLFQAAGNNAVRRDLINLDASKMAASKVDFSHSLWTRRGDDPTGKAVSYYGCFFGAERLEIGDAVRVKMAGAEANSSQTTVMGLLHIFTSADYPGSVFFRGPIYQLSKQGPSAAAAAAAAGGAVIDDEKEKLPLALQEEVRWRTQVTRGRQWCWVLIKDNVVFKEQSIRGRFYPTHRLMPIYNPNEFGALVAGQQPLRDQHIYLNNRMDGAGGRHIGRKANRLDTLGPCVPHTARLMLEPHIQEE
ncbi:hypothetical protein HDV57DRAFT_74424 [Trichoderma longibrachiatum]|uniref:Cryptic loci regulator 2 N-terminal domain-containing protein n=1 Tax=Trichoderma longibrachiatum ATCC 18648 TaxID=983965 RepID=A0A2T4BUS6_TRILO|nr:hypothetical protein M440DRAFT_1433257 [Trichoderma longibrachiatum ATCC 18648]